MLLKSLIQVGVLAAASLSLTACYFDDGDDYRYHRPHFHHYSSNDSDAVALRPAATPLNVTPQVAPGNPSIPTGNSL